MNSDLENKTIARLDAMNDEEWLAFMAYFSPKMLDEQKLLGELLCRRAEAKAKIFNEEAERRNQICRHLPADEISLLITSCGLKLGLK